MAMQAKSLYTILSISISALFSQPVVLPRWIKVPRTSLSELAYVWGSRLPHQAKSTLIISL
jgi:hypothetical protein